MAETTSLVADYVLMEKLRAFLRATFGQGNYVIDVRFNPMLPLSLISCTKTASDWG